MKTVIPHSRPMLGKEEMAKAADVIRSGNLAQGREVRRLEKKLSSFIGGHAVACSSGSSALHLALLGLGVGKGEKARLPSYACNALLNAVNMAGAKPSVQDVGYGTFNMLPSGGKSAAIVPHMFGLPADLGSFKGTVIEDCAHAIGAKYRGKRVGGIGDAAIFSFYATKMLCAGEGGAVIAKKKAVAKKVMGLRDYTEHETRSITYNYKLTDLQAAIAAEQLKKLPKFIRRRQEIAKIYGDEFEKLEIGLPVKGKGQTHNYYRYVVKVKNAERFRKAMAGKGIRCGYGVRKPIHQVLGLNAKKFPNSEKLSKKAASIPIYPALREWEINAVVKAVREVVK